MRILGVLALLAVSWAGPAWAQHTDYIGVQKKWSSSEVMAVLGASRARQWTPQNFTIPLPEVEVQSQFRCGQLDLNVNVEEMWRDLKAIPGQLAASGSAVLAGLPLMSICYASPSLCAELKNLNFRMDHKLKGLTDVCMAMNRYTNAQANSETVKEAALKRGFNKCMEDATEGGSSASSAAQECSRNPTRLLHTDIAKNWLTKATNQPVRLLEGLLRQTGQLTDSVGNDEYRFLAGLLGELQFSLDGKLIPVFPIRPTTAAEVAKLGVMYASLTTCNQANLSRVINSASSNQSGGGDTAFLQKRIEDVLRESVSSVDIQNLFVLDPPDIDVACHALARSVGRAAVARAADEGEATLAKAMQNPELPESVGATLATNAEQVFRALRNQDRDTGITRPIPELRIIVAKMANLVRARRAEIAAALSQGEMDMQELSHVDCDSDYTCP